MEENAVIKIEKGLKSAKITIMTNVPKRQGFGTFKINSAMDKLFARRYFEDKARQEADKIAFCNHLGIAVRDKPKSEASLFMEAYFKSKLHGRPKGKYQKSNYIAT